MSETDSLKLGHTDTPLRIDSRAAAQAAIAGLINQTQRRLIIFAPNLDPQLFNSSAVQEALSHIVKRRLKQPVTILVQDYYALVRENPRLVDLCRRFSSFFKIHHVAAEQIARSEMFVVADGIGFVHQPTLEQQSYLAVGRAGLDAASLQNRFEAMWDKSEPAPEVHPAGL